MDADGEMTESGTPSFHSADLVGRALYRLAHAFAIAGGALMAGLIGMVVVSVAGRNVLGTPIYGDFELVAMGTAIAVSLFLPYCHLNRGNVIVDLFLARAPLRVRTGCDVAGSLLLAGLAGLLTWRTLLGGLELADYGEVTMILAIPVWWAFPFVVSALGLLAVCGLYTAACDAARLIR